MPARPRHAPERPGTVVDSRPAIHAPVEGDGVGLGLAGVLLGCPRGCGFGNATDVVKPPLATAKELTHVYLFPCMLYVSERACVYEWVQLCVLVQSVRLQGICRLSQKHEYKQVYK